MARKSSFAVELLVIILLGIFASCVLMWCGFTVGMRVNANRQTRQVLYESSSHLRDSIDSRLRECALVLDFTARNTLPVMNESPVNITRLRDIFQTSANIHPDVKEVFGTSVGRYDEPDGFMVFSSGWRPANLVYDNTAAPWHKDAMAGMGQIVFTTPYIEEKTSELVVSIVKGVNRGIETIGVVGLDVSMADLNEMANSKSIVDEVTSFLIHSSGKYITHTDSSRIMTIDFFEDKGFEEYREQVLSSDSFYSADGYYIICTMTVPITGWTLVSYLPKHTIYRAGNRTGYISMGMVAFGMIMFFVIFYPIVKRKVKPIVLMTEELKEIAEGEGDLTKAVAVKSKNEIGDLANYFNLTIEKIRKLIVNIKEEGNILSEIGSELAANMNETASAVNEITANIQSIKERIVNQSASVSETHSTMDQVTVNINKLNDHVENQSSHISQASAAIEEMVANIQSVAETLVKNAANVKTLRESSDVGKTGLEDVASDIKEIARESEGLMEINAVMDNIASQTNLLSMNAAIEAAHAGEAGKGFAVVADEIRKLAENSSEQSKTISGVLKKIKESIEKITFSTENVLEKFGAIDSSVKTVSQQEDIIRNAMEEQGIGSKQILDGIGHVNEITRQVQGGSNEMLVGAKEVIRESTNLEKATQEIKSGMNEMASGADHINTAVNHVNEISRKNREAIASLIKEVSRFKV